MNAGVAAASDVATDTDLPAVDGVAVVSPQQRRINCAVETMLCWMVRARHQNRPDQRVHCCTANSHVLVVHPLVLWPDPLCNCGRLCDGVSIGRVDVVCCVEAPGPWLVATEG